MTPSSSEWRTGRCRPNRISRSDSVVVPYDLTNQDRVIRERMPSLEIINDHFSRFIRNTLSSSLRKILEVSIHGIQMIKFGEFIRTLPVPSSLHIFKMEPLRGHAILVLDPKMVFTLIDLFLGGIRERDLPDRGAGIHGH